MPGARRGPYPGTVASDGRGSYRFALRPLWILSHIFVLLCILGMFRAGIWQLDRLQQRRDLNETVAARTEEAPVPLGDAAAATEADGVEATEYRPVEVVGAYVADEQVLVRNRSQGGSPGYWVLTPMRDDGGLVVTVNRGWVPIEVTERGDAGTALFAPPEGDVVAVGYVRVSEERRGLGVVDPPGRLDTLSRVDVPRLDEQVSEDLVPFWIQLAAQDPAQPDGVPEVVPLPEPDDGPHLNYAGQWFIYGTLTAIVYPLLLRRRARKPAERAGRPDIVRDETVAAPR